jgi:hypothetical protein
VTVKGNGVNVCCKMAKGVSADGHPLFTPPSTNERQFQTAR